jgi:hypothetical protein
VTVFLQQYTLRKDSYTETTNLKLWAVSEPSMTFALVFGSMLFASAGAAVSMASSQKEQMKETWCG